MPDQTDTTLEYDRTTRTDAPGPLEQLAQRVAERDPTPIDEHPDFDTLEEYNPDTPLTGRVEAWFTHRSDGAIINGAFCLPGTYSVVTCPEDQDPDELFGTEFTATPVGWYHSPVDGKPSQDIPDTPGTYLFVTPLQDECH